MNKITTDRAVVEQALEALRAMNPYPASKEDQRAGALTALRAALAQEQAEPDHETRAELAEQQVVQLAEERDHYRNLWQKAQQAEPVQEPAFHGFMSDDGAQVDVCFSPSAPRKDGTYATAYYTAPPQRDALLQALQNLVSGCQRMDLEHQAERPSEAEYQTAMKAAQAAIQAVEGAA